MAAVGKPRPEGALLDPQPLMRQMAARHIGMRELEAFEVRPALREALQDPDPEVRRAARNALDDTSVWVAIQSERLTQEEMIAILHQALSHEDPAVRIEAEQGLAQLGEPAG